MRIVRCDGRSLFIVPGFFAHWLRMHLFNEQDSFLKKENEEIKESKTDLPGNTHEKTVLNNNQEQKESELNISDTFKEKFDEIKQSVSSFWNDREDSQTVMERLRNTHGDAIVRNAQPEKSMSESVKETDEEIKDSVSNFVTEKKEETQSAIEKFLNAHNDAVTQNLVVADPLPLKTPNADLPDTKFLQNA